MSEGRPRIYHHHVRKTAGSSLNAAFWALAGHMSLDTREMKHGVDLNGLKFVTSNRALIESGDYFFATSHHPAWWIALPPETFTITILRDPVSRLISYYRYLSWVRANPNRYDAEPALDAVAAEGIFLDGGLGYVRNQLSLHGLRFERSAIQAFGPWRFLARLRPRRRETAFRDFLERVPPRHLYTQLHMFSECFDPGEAAENALACSAVCFTETFSDDLRKLSKMLGLNLEERHERRFAHDFEATDTELDMARERLAPEYEMIDRVRAALI